MTRDHGIQDPGFLGSMIHMVRGDGQHSSARVHPGDAILVGVVGMPGGMARACPHTSRPGGDNYGIQSTILYCREYFLSIQVWT